LTELLFDKLKALMRAREAAMTSQAPKPTADYLTFLAEDDIRVKGTRIGIEHILDEYIHNAKSPEAIAQRFPTVTLEQVYATILFYLQNPVTVGQYVSDWLDYTLKAEAEQDNDPDPALQRLKEIKASRTAA
jgi:uncharacterized protein (DUF433 family)